MNTRGNGERFDLIVLIFFEKGQQNINLPKTFGKNLKNI